MTTRIQLLALTIFGNVAIAALFFWLATDQLDDQQKTNLENSALVYQRAWNTASSESYDLSIGMWHPQTGTLENRSIWKSKENFLASSEKVPNIRSGNPLYKAFKQGDTDSIVTLIDDLFQLPIDEMNISAVFVLDARDEIIHCMTAYDGYGIDPCADNAKYNFEKLDMGTATGMLSKRRTERVPVKRGILRVDDLGKEEESSLYQALYVALRDDSSKLGTIVLAKNIFEALESFEYEFEIKAALNFNRRTITLNNYYETDNYSGISSDVDIAGEASNSLREYKDVLLVNGTFGAMNTSLEASVFGFPLSDFAKGEEALLIVLRDQTKLLEAQDEAMGSTFIYGTAVFTVVVLLVIWLVSRIEAAMKDAYDQASTANREIQSSINYAAKLQRALLRAERMPDDFKIDLTWRPRDIVGGDIYVVRTTDNKTVIAVIDCTGHGVPGAFTSVIARAVVDRAIEDDQINTAGEYLSESNRLIKDMLFQNESEEADSDAGFDGTVCILDRQSGCLEFAGANSSLFVVNNNETKEIKGNKKSVGARRTPQDFEFTTQIIDNPSGMFVMLTDGVTDVMNEQPRPTAFGRKRLMRLLQTLETSEPKLVVSKVMDAIDQYKGSTALRDDLTLLAFYIDESDSVFVSDVSTVESMAG
ncbi:MAG: hypothetical protein CBC09_09150 [Cellvibrionales bacterium TMED49]|nr:MAG: hypothetical protein CBC09_09150 [Cellvibrionales bacterium TMED49]